MITLLRFSRKDLHQHFPYREKSSARRWRRLRLHRGGMTADPGSETRMQRWCFASKATLSKALRFYTEFSSDFDSSWNSR